MRCERASGAAPLHLHSRARPPNPCAPPPTLPQGLTLFAVGAAIMAYGFYKVGQGNKARRWVKHEQLERRLALVPFLQAEEDRRWVNAKAEFDATEAEVMKGVSATPTPTPARVGVVVGRRAGCCDRPAPRLRDGGVGCSRCRAIAPPPQVPGYNPGESVYKTRWMPPARPVGVWGEARG